MNLILFFFIRKPGFIYGIEFTSRQLSLVMITIHKLRVECVE